MTLPNRNKEMPLFGLGRAILYLKPLRRNGFRVFQIGRSMSLAKYK